MLSLFNDHSLEICKIDITFDAGALYQPKFLVAGITNQLFPIASLHHSAQQIAEFIDYRGIIVEPNTDTYTACLSVYSLRRYMAELLPLLCEILASPAFPEEDFLRLCRKRKQQLLTSFQKTNQVARNLFYEGLYGSQHILGRYASPDDADKIALDDVRSFFHDRYNLDQAQFQLAGPIDDELLASFRSTFPSAAPIQTILPPSVPTEAQFSALSSQPSVHSPQLTAHSLHTTIPNSVQSTIRLGRILPLRWDDPDYARFMVLNTILGGYFGSRLMTSVREEKGYTYGIYSQTHIYRDSIVFSISADVGNEVVQPALQAILDELKRLQDEPVSDKELDIVRHYMEGDFLRSIDGLFECSERYRQMQIIGLSERFTNNFFAAIRTVTPTQLQALAQRFLSSSDLLQVIVGS